VPNSIDTFSPKPEKNEPPEFSARRLAKREKIIAVALRHFAEHGFTGTRIDDIAKEMDVAKGLIFQYFGTKDGLFLEAYKRAVRSFPSYLQAPAEIQRKGFFETIRYWLARTEHLIGEDWVPYRVSLLGNYAANLDLKREITRFLTREDPYGTVAFVKWGIERGEVRNDIDLEMIVSVLDWTVERFQDALLTQELDPGLFRRRTELPEHKERRIEQFLGILRGAIGSSKRPA
jgi:TetR/AcrR family transcriptional regulator